MAVTRVFWHAPRRRRRPNALPPAGDQADHAQSLVPAPAKTPKRHKGNGWPLHNLGDDPTSAVRRKSQPMRAFPHRSLTSRASDSRMAESTASAS